MCRIMSFSIAGLIVVMATASGSAKDAVPWAPDLDSAQDRASRENRLVLIHFWSPDCVPCSQLDLNVLSQPHVGRSIAEDYVPVKVNVRQMPELARRFGVERWPTDVVITPAGYVVQKMSCLQDPEKYVGQLKWIADRSGVSQSHVAGSGDARSHGYREASAQYEYGGRSNPSRPRAADNRWETPARPRADAQLAGTGDRWNSPPTREQVSDSLYREQPRKEAGFAPRYAELGQVPPPSERSQTAMETPRHAHQPTGGQSPFGGREETVDAYAGATTRWHNMGTAEQTRPAERGDLRLSANDSRWSPDAAGWPNPDRSRQTVGPGASSDTAGRFSQTDNRRMAADDRASRWSDYRDVREQTQPRERGVRREAFAARTDREEVRDRTPWAEADAAGKPHASGDDAWKRWSSDEADRTGQRPSQETHTAGPAGKPPVALDGFCPVVVAENMKWVKGDPRVGAVHRGRTYLLSDADARRRFLADPDRFSPVLAGYDPVRLAEQDQLVPGKRQHGVFYGHQIFLFADEAALEQFWRAPRKYVDFAVRAVNANDRRTAKY